MEKREYYYPSLSMTILIPSKEEENIHSVVYECERLYPESQIIISNDRDGRGKGWALRESLAHAGGDIIVFIDGDGDISPRMILRLLPFIYDYDIVIGRKQVRGFLSRRILTVFSRLYIWMLFGVIYDTQTGIKMFRREAIRPWITDSYAFDIEILTDAHDRGMEIIEVPVEAEASKKMKASSVVKCFAESLRIWRRRWERKLARLKDGSKKRVPKTAGQEKKG